MTRFAYEVPINHLEDFEEFQQLHFGLSFLCRENSRYFDYLKNQIGKKKVILDNSFNELERPDSPKEMAYLFKELKADMLVSPDSDSWSLKELEDAYNELKEYIPQEKILIVVRSKEEFRRFENKPYCTTFYHRPNLSKVIVTWSYHFLGLCNIPEISENNPISCDTSMPIKLALRGETINDWVKQGYPHYHTRKIKNFFDLTLTEDQLELAKENCSWLNANLAR